MNYRSNQKKSPSKDRRNFINKNMNFQKTSNNDYNNLLEAPIFFEDNSYINTNIQNSDPFPDHLYYNKEKIEKKLKNQEQKIYYLEKKNQKLEKELHNLKKIKAGFNEGRKNNSGKKNKEFLKIIDQLEFSNNKLKFDLENLKMNSSKNAQTIISEKDYLIDNLKTENVYLEKKNKNLEDERSFLSLKNNNREEKSNNKIISILKMKLQDSEFLNRNLKNKLNLSHNEIRMLENHKKNLNDDLQILRRKNREILLTNNNLKNDLKDSSYVIKEMNDLKKVTADLKKFNFNSKKNSKIFKNETHKNMLLSQNSENSYNHLFSKKEIFSEKNFKLSGHELINPEEVFSQYSEFH